MSLKLSGTIVAGFFDCASMRNFPSGKSPENFRVGAAGHWNDREPSSEDRVNVELLGSCR